MPAAIASAAWPACVMNAAPPMSVESNQRGWMPRYSATSQIDICSPPSDGKRRRGGEPVDVAELQPGVGERPEDALRLDRERVHARRLPARRLVHADDRHLSAGKRHALLRLVSPGEVCGRRRRRLLASRVPPYARGSVRPAAARSAASGRPAARARPSSRSPGRAPSARAARRGPRRGRRSWPTDRPARPRAAAPRRSSARPARSSRARPRRTAPTPGRRRGPVRPRPRTPSCAARSGCSRRTRAAPRSSFHHAQVHSSGRRRSSSRASATAAARTS